PMINKIKKLWYKAPVRLAVILICMQYKAAIFDLDGTLVDSLKDIAASANYVLDHYNLPVIPVDKFRYLAGQGADALLRDSLGDNQAEHLKEAVALWHKYYGEHMYDNTRPFDGIEQMLD